MSQCLRCSKPCAETSVFCEECQTRSENEFIFAPTNTPFVENELSPFSTIPLSDSEDSAADRAVAGLNAAARWMEEEEVGGKRLRRSARLAPLRDISQEIHRASTPHPRTLRPQGFPVPPGTEAKPADTPVEEQPVEQKAGKNWSWTDLILDEEEEKESDIWSNTTDPLLARSRPVPGASASIEEEDIQRAQFENHTTLPYPKMYRQTRSPRLTVWQMVFGAIVILAVAALLVDGLLLSFAFNHAKHLSTNASGPPTLTLSENTASVNTTMSVQLTHFAPQTKVALTHDVQETLLTTAHSSTLNIDASGKAHASFVINNAWQSGSHLIVAEDITTRNTASAILQVNSEGPARPAHLLLDTPSLDLGEGVQGTDTIQPLVLHNSGSGSITWSVSSDQPWLLVAPQQGTFGSGQTISVAAQRSVLSPGTYKGSVTISSNVGEPQQLPVSMTVAALPPDAGPVISLSPPLLSFTATDGLAAPETQVLTLSNPGQQELHWSLAGSTTTPTIVENTPGTPVSSSNTSSWLRAYPSSGSLASGQSIQIHLTATSQSLLPGAYMSTLTFSSHQGGAAYDTPQIAGVFLTIEPHCGLVTSTGLLSFTAVAGQSNPSAHVLSLNETSSCAGATVTWKALPSASWITANPANGQVKGTSSSFASIGVNTMGLTPGIKYSGLVTFQSGTNTQTVVVQLLLQPRPAPSVPILGTLPLSLNFSSIQGEANPAGQVVTITNNGGNTLKWRTSISTMDSSWITASVKAGTVQAGQTGQITVTVKTAGLTPGTYTGQIILLGTDAKGKTASGNPQTITVSLIVQPPCTLSQPSASALRFSGTAGAGNPLSQAVTLTGSGSCAWPLQWNASVVTSGASWVVLSPASGTLNSATQQKSMAVGVNTSGLQPGTYYAQVKISASDLTRTQAQNAPQMVNVTLTILQPCTLQGVTSSLSFSASQGQASAPSQTLNLSETGSCGGGVAWTAAADGGSSAWLGLSATSGNDDGGGDTVVVTATPGNLAPGNYSGQITLSASNNGVVLQGSPQTISVTLSITGYTVSGTVETCNGPTPDCTTAQNLAGATVSLLNSSGNTIATVTADGSGNFTFTNVPLGNYSFLATGTSGGATYNGSGTISVNGNTSNATIQTFAS